MGRRAAVRSCSPTTAALRRSAAALCALALAGLALPAAAHAPAGAACERSPEPSRWTATAEPDPAVERMQLMVHRGAAELAPENTLWAFRYAVAYDVEYIEVDVQQTLDHRYVAFHDLQVDRKTDGSGYINAMTFDQVRALNAAANETWQGSAYDPARIPSLEEVLELAAETGVGVVFDLKESVTDTASVALLAARYGLVERSIFQPYVPGRAEQIKAAAPDARLLLSNQGFEELPGGAPRGAFYAASAEYAAFGSTLRGFDAGRVNEAHDGCAVVIPNVYQGHVTGSEAGDLLRARALGADGAQVDRPDVAVAALGRPVATVLEPGDGVVCLLDAEHRQGLPGKALELGDGSTAVTGLGGCAQVAAPAGRVRFAGDGSALASTAVVSPRG
jgi:glycerophosphoryl diester phosphodiesterase